MNYYVSGFMIIFYYFKKDKQKKFIKKLKLDVSGI